MAGFAKATIQGNLTADPETRATKSGKNVISLRVAVNRSFVSGGQRREEVSYFDVAAFGKLGELCAKHLTKGSEVTVIGNLNQSRWESDEGQKRSRIEILADEVIFGRKPNGSQPAPEESTAEPIPDAE